MGSARDFRHHSITVLFSKMEEYLWTVGLDNLAEKGFLNKKMADSNMKGVIETYPALVTTSSRSSKAED